MDKSLLSVLQIQLFILIDVDIVVVDIIRKSVVEDDDVRFKVHVCGTVTVVDVTWQ